VPAGKTEKNGTLSEVEAVHSFLFCSGRLRSISPSTELKPSSFDFAQQLTKNSCKNISIVSFDSPDSPETLIHFRKEQYYDVLEHPEIAIQSINSNIISAFPIFETP
jgi:hypothetical protein